MVTILVPPLQSRSLLVVLAIVALVSGLSALVRRFVERPREVVVRKVHHERDARVIH